MSQPLSLTDEQMTLRAAEPLPPDLRSPFLAAVAHALQGVPIGDGSVHRVCRELQREFFAPPDLSKARDQSKWR